MNVRISKGRVSDSVEAGRLSGVEVRIVRIDEVSVELDACDIADGVMCGMSLAALYSAEPIILLGLTEQMSRLVSGHLWNETDTLCVAGGSALNSLIVLGIGVRGGKRFGYTLQEGHPFPAVEEV